MRRQVTRMVFACSLLATAAANAAPTGHPSALITESVNPTRVEILEGNTRPEAKSANDVGRVPDELPLNHLVLQLKRSAEREFALEQYIAELHDSHSVSFHQWLTPEQFAEHFGVADADVATVKNWLAAQGFTVHGVTPNGMNIDFSGTAGQVRAAFGTEIHTYRVNGVKHIANATDPKIPAALASAVAGIVSLHDFRPKAQFVRRQALTTPAYTYTSSNGTFHALAAGDIATIYNLKPLFEAGISGRGETIMVVEDTYLYSTKDWSAFRKTFGLNQYTYGNLKQVSPAGAISCPNPGFQGNSSDPGYGDDGEAAIDVEWATAAAPNATIVLAACTDSTTTFGGLIALINTLNGPASALPSVVSISYGEAEALNGQASNLSYFYAYQQAVAEGVSVFVSSGDEDGASADGGSPASHGLGISAFTSTPYNVSVGGLDFGYTALGVDPANYWSSANSSSYSSALSYIQEIPWNNSCAGGLVAAYLSTTPLALCNSSQVTSSTGSLNSLQNAVGGSGGLSGCAFGSPGISGVVSGSCKGYSQPSWQAGLIGVPKNSVRNIPDVALFASNGFWDAYYVVCWSNPDPNVGGGLTCTGAPSTWAGFGGTSVSAPIMAGIQALVNQKTGSRWGNPNTTYYAIARNEYGATGSTACNSATVNKFSNSCSFYDITQGDNVADCEAGAITVNCYIPKNDTFGLLSLSSHTEEPAFVAARGWDFTSGIGSVNAFNLVMHWP